MLGGRAGAGLLFLGQLLACPVAAQAQAWPAMPGAPGHATVAVGHANLTLPPGDWTAVSEGSDNPLQSGGQSLDIQTRWLAQMAAGQVVATISIRSNVTRSSAGWRKDPQCLWRNVAFYLNRSEFNKSFDCMMVNPRVFSFGDNPSESWISTFDKLHALGKFPHTMVCAFFSMASRSRLDFVSVHVCLNPALAGTPDDPAQSLSSSDWNKVRLKPDRQAFVGEVVRWAEIYHQTVADAF